MKKVLLVLIVCLLCTGCFNEEKKKVEYDSIFDYDKVFSKKDLDYSYDEKSIVKYTANNKDINIDNEGEYLISGKSKNITININAKSSDKVKLVLKDLEINNTNKPCINIQNADKVFIILEGKNKLNVSKTFSSKKEDGVIYSKDDLVINGKGSIDINSSSNGVICNDDLKITGGSINIVSVAEGFRANNSINITKANIVINSKNDGLQCEYDKDKTIGNIYIYDGSIDITAVDDAIHATSAIEVDNADINLKAREGLEGTYVQINGGNINITGEDDGINAARQSEKYSPLIEINGGNINIKATGKDADGLDSNGDIVINDVIINIVAKRPFDYKGEAKYNGGTIVVNDEIKHKIENSEE